MQTTLTAAEKTTPKHLNLFEQYLTVWVSLSMGVGVLVEVPVMLSVCSFCNRTRHWFAQVA